MRTVAWEEIASYALLGFTLALMIVLIVGMARRKPLRQRRLLIAAMQLLFNGTLGALVSRTLILMGVQGGWAYVLNWLCVTASYLFGVLTFLFITLYVRNDNFENLMEAISTDQLTNVLWALNAFVIIAVITNPVTHAIFYITPDNAFSYGSFRWLVELILAVETVLIAAATLRMRGKAMPLMTNKLILCCVLIIVGTGGSLINHGLSLVFPSAALLLTLLGVGVQATLEEQLAQAQTEAAESRVRLLSGQIHPHFVFNSLNAIKGLIVEDPVLAEQAVQDFSDYLRSHLDVMSDSRLVPFSEEMEHVRHYVALEMADSTCPMDVSYDFETEDFLIPPLTVQPLVENAVRHGIRTHEGGGQVKITTREFDDVIAITVEGSGEGASSVTERQSERRRVGFDNVRERIERQCGGRIEKSFGEDGSVVVIMLPKGERV